MVIGTLAHWHISTFVHCKYLQFSINGNKFYCIFVASNSLKRQNEEVKREFTVGFQPIYPAQRLAHHS